MTLTALAFALGAAWLQQQAALPSLAWVLALPPILLLALWKKQFFVIAALAAGFLWAAWLAQLRMADWLAPELEGRDLQVVGVVSSLPAVGERGVRFEFEVESAA